MSMTTSMSAPSAMAIDEQPIRPIKTDADLDRALLEIERLWGGELGTPEGDRLDVLATLIHAYEAERWPVETPDPISAIKFAMEQQGLNEADLVPMIGPRECVVEVLSGKTELTLTMIRRLHEGLGISADVLIK